MVYGDADTIRLRRIGTSGVGCANVKRQLQPQSKIVKDMFLALLSGARSSLYWWPKLLTFATPFSSKCHNDMGLGSLGLEHNGCGRIVGDH